MISYLILICFLFCFCFIYCAEGHWGCEVAILGNLGCEVAARITNTADFQ